MNEHRERYCLWREWLDGIEACIESVDSALGDDVERHSRDECNLVGMRAELAGKAVILDDLRKAVGRVGELAEWCYSESLR